MIDLLIDPVAGYLHAVSAIVEHPVAFVSYVIEKPMQAVEFGCTRELFCSQTCRPTDWLRCLFSRERTGIKQAR